MCPTYKCLPPSEPSNLQRNISEIVNDGNCSMTSRMFRTFDGTDFSYDICHHILVRDKKQRLWTVSGYYRLTICTFYCYLFYFLILFSNQNSVHKNCDTEGVNCSRSLRIEHRKHTLDFLPGLKVAHKGFEYSVYQVRCKFFEFNS